VVGGKGIVGKVAGNRKDKIRKGGGNRLGELTVSGKRWGHTNKTFGGGVPTRVKPARELGGVKKNREEKKLSQRKGGKKPIFS